MFEGFLMIFDGFLWVSQGFLRISNVFDDFLKLDSVSVLWIPIAFLRIS